MSELEIPAESRRVVEQRDGGCVRCGMNGRDWHHRRSRRVRDEHTHCPCNGVLLCRTCHSWAHVADNGNARHQGWIASQWLEVPANGPIWVDGYWLHLLCDGRARLLRPEQVVRGPLGHPLVVQGLRSAS